MPEPLVRRASVPSASGAEAGQLPLAALIYQERSRLSLSQERLATLVNEAAKTEKSYCGATRQTVHKWERGQTPHPDTVRWIAIALDLPVERLAAARALQMELTRRELLRRAATSGGVLVLAGGAGFMSEGRTATPTASLSEPRATEIDEIIGHLRRSFDEFDKADWLFGPQLVLPTVERYLALLNRLLASATGSIRTDLLMVGARYAEFASWMNQDRGDVEAARVCADVALEWSLETNDTAMVSYVLMRKSSQAEVLRDAGRTIGLARAAQQQSGELPARIHAVAAQQEANGHALAGDDLACHRKLDEAVELARLDQPSHLPGRYCIPTFVEIQRATCWIELGKPKLAVELLERELAHLPPIHRRDRGVYLARLAQAQAAMGDPDAAAANTRQAMDLAGTTGSGRIIAELRKLQPRFAEWQNVSDVAELHSALVKLG